MLGPVQKGNTVDGSGKIVAGDDYSNNHIHNYSRETKLSKLFDRLREVFNEDNRIDDVHDDLQRYLLDRDQIGLEQKLIDGDLWHLYEDAEWLKEEYSKKLTKYVFYEPAQHIHAYLLAIIIEKFRNLIYPLFRNGCSESEILRTISCEINDPLLKIISEEGCNDIMGLNSTDIDGMIYFLTGRCHIRWKS